MSIRRSGWVTVLRRSEKLTTDDACYLAMDWLHEVRHALERQVFSQVAAALDLEVDLLFFDTTSTLWVPITCHGR
jgi:hypothetical protein